MILVWSTLPTMALHTVTNQHLVNYGLVTDGLRKRVLSFILHH
jgi:hypothetical protein